MKSSSRACLPGAQNCRISIAPIPTTASGRQQSMPAVGGAESQSDQDERQRMFAVLAEVGVRPKPGWTQRCERDGGGEKPGEDSKNDRHRGEVIGFIRRIFVTLT
jgi:hypothetical protein